MANEDKKIEFLTLAHDINERADRAIAQCEKVLENPDVPEVVKLWFLEVQTALKLQRSLSKNLMEANLAIEDQIDDLVTRVQNLPKK